MTVPETVVLPITPYPKGVSLPARPKAFMGVHRDAILPARRSPSQIGSRRPGRSGPVHLAGRLQHPRPVLLLDLVGRLVRRRVAGDGGTLDGAGHPLTVDRGDLAGRRRVAPLPRHGAALA